MAPPGLALHAERSVFVPKHEIGVFVSLAVQIVGNVIGHAGTELHPETFGRRLGGRDL